MDFCLLSKFDDLFSDIFLDAQFLWFDTIKLNNDHRRPRIRSDKVLKIIQDKILPTGKTNEAVKELLRYVMLGNISGWGWGNSNSNSDTLVSAHGPLTGKRRDNDGECRRNTNGISSFLTWSTRK